MFFPEIKFCLSLATVLPCHISDRLIIRTRLIVCRGSEFREDIFCTDSGLHAPGNLKTESFFLHDPDRTDFTIPDRSGITGRVVYLNINPRIPVGHIKEVASLSRQKAVLGD